MTREEKEYLLEAVEGFELQADDTFAALDTMAEEMAETPGCKLLAAKARKAAKASQELCESLAERVEQVQDQLD